MLALLWFSARITVKKTGVRQSLTSDMLEADAESPRRPSFSSFMASSTLPKVETDAETVMLFITSSTLGQLSLTSQGKISQVITHLSVSASGCRTS